MFTYLAHASPLHRLNPAVKLLTMTAVGLAATFVYSPWVPGLLAVGLWCTVWWVGRVPLGRLLRWSLYMLALPWPLMLFTALYTDLSRYPNPHLLVQWGPWTVAQESLLMALTLGLRVLVFVAASLLFIATTDPTDFAVSLAQNLRVPYRFAYGVLVAHRFLPLLRRELTIIRLAHRVRGVGEGRGVRGALERVRRYAIPLLAAALRKSERTALAMDAKAFGAGPDRTYFRTLPVRPRDGLFLLAWLLYIALAYAVAARLGPLNWMWIPQT